MFETILCMKIKIDGKEGWFGDIYWWEGRKYSLVYPYHGALGFIDEAEGSHFANHFGIEEHEWEMIPVLFDVKKRTHPWEVVDVRDVF